IDGERARVGEEDSVAISRAAGDRPRRDGAAGAAAILYHDLLAERFAHLVRDYAPERIVAAAGRKRDDKRHRPGGIGLGGGGAWSERRCEGADGNEEGTPSHLVFRSNVVVIARESGRSSNHKPAFLGTA